MTMVNNASMWTWCSCCQIDFKRAALSCRRCQ